MNWLTLIAIGSGGFLGAIARTYFVLFSNKNISIGIFPVGTLLVNILGSFALGMLYAYFNNTTHISQTVKSFLTMGFLSSFTTYSTFAIESMLLFSNHTYLAIINIILNLTGTIIAAAIGYKLLKYIVL
jgi:CrcB protein